MIRVAKPIAPPAVLVTRGIPAAQSHCNDYTASPADYRSGAKNFKFNKKIYAATAVKNALLAAQHGKCAFCESFVSHISYGDIEHFRPKAGYKQRKGDKLKRPGYYWLAYDWDNLFFCCQLCNEEFKNNHFPLKNGHNRANSHTDNLSDEEPLLIHPVRLDPVAHITFRKERAVAVSGSAEGKATIRVLGLNRPALREARVRRLQNLKRLLRLRDLFQDKIATSSTPALVKELANVNDALLASQQDTAEYSAMARAFLAP
jgi:uncharacterized protein (TIGR02646 family)